MTHSARWAAWEGCPVRVRTEADGRLLELAADLKGYAAVDAGLSCVYVGDVLAATANAPAMPWAAVRRQMLDHGFEVTTCDFTGLCGAVDTPDGVRGSKADRYFSGRDPAPLPAGGLGGVEDGLAALAVAGL